MLHQAVEKHENDSASGYKTRVGAWMFGLYSIVYAGFVALNLLSPAAMEASVLFGLNVAVVYGFGLIAFALFLAIIYNGLCVREERRRSTDPQIDGKTSTRTTP